MKNHILTFLLALLVVLAATTLRKTIASNTAAPHMEPAIGMAIGGAPIPYPPRYTDRMIGGAPIPYPPKATSTSSTP